MTRTAPVQPRQLPRLINVLLGHISLVGPRPDVPGFGDELTGTDRVIRTVRPAITGPATVYSRHEEELLAAQDEPGRYNREVLSPAKVALNRRYPEQYSLAADLRLLLATVGELPPRTAQTPR